MLTSPPLLSKLDTFAKLFERNISIYSSNLDQYYYRLIGELFNSAKDFLPTVNKYKEQLFYSQKTESIFVEMFTI